ncbi:PRD domain-containing protein [Vibrio sp. S11_S32]|uniref:PRD domain-containing protein n=1 Tax=Vibrio sp. S11_S32 TaxID=2720225 RepID=UPI001D77D7ED|nr:PRD domain-containing protein [Vibrio sp. S11_S32]
MTNTVIEINEEQLKPEFDELFNRSVLLLKENKIFPDEIQQQMLFVHLKAMVVRSHTGESIPEIEVEMFEEISELSHELAKQIVSTVKNIAFEETYLLSVHFEVAKENELTSEIGE